MAFQIPSLSLLSSVDKNILQNIFVSLQQEIQQIQQQLDALQSSMQQPVKYN
jgi:hypothetical protein